MDEAHEALSGPAATQKILYREYYDFGDGAICAALGPPCASGVHRSPRPAGVGRVDWLTIRFLPVSPGIWAKTWMEAKASSTSTLTTGSEALVTLSWLSRALASAPGQVTQWEVLGAVPQIGEAWLIPVLAAMPKPSGSSMKSHFNPV